jgi:hypothetical protein
MSNDGGIRKLRTVCPIFTDLWSYVCEVNVYLSQYLKLRYRRRVYSAPGYRVTSSSTYLCSSISSLFLLSFQSACLLLAITKMEILDHLSSCLRILYRHLASLGACGRGRVHVLCCKCCASVAVQDPLQAPTGLDRCSAHYVQGMRWLRSQPSVVQQVPGVAL